MMPLSIATVVAFGAALLILIINPASGHAETALMLGVGQFLGLTALYLKTLFSKES